MTSTEFTVGVGEGTRISSKVLKPPGGGSSDIFGVGNYQAGSNSRGSSNENSSTHSRVFGSNSSVPVKNSSLQSNIKENKNTYTPHKQSKKVYMRRNPITGEEVEICMEAENGDKNGCDKEDKDEEMESVPSKPVQTSIRVRNPPGGKSSGIF